MTAATIGLFGGCSISGTVANAIAESGGGYGSDDDPELVAHAAPFGLKTMEAVLEKEPEHVGLLVALARGFTQYAYAFVDLPATEWVGVDVDRGLRMKARAQRLYQRARRYGLRAIEVEHPAFEQRLRGDPVAALAEMGVDDVPSLFWTAVSWGLAIAVAKNDPSEFADLPLVTPIAERILALDEAYEGGAIHELLFALEASRPGGDLEKAKRHFERAEALSGGAKAGLYVAYAENVAVKTQDLKAFVEKLDKALGVDVDAAPENRLVNILMRSRAQQLKNRAADLFVDAED